MLRAMAGPRARACAALTRPRARPPCAQTLAITEWRGRVRKRMNALDSDKEGKVGARACLCVCMLVWRTRAAAPSLSHLQDS